jgi:ADP-ribose pyrophosphatase
MHEETLDSELLVDGKLLKVYRDRVRLRDGSESVREWIDHPGAAAVVPLFEDGKTLLVAQYRYPSRRQFLEVPAGKLDRKGESPEVVAARELEEETGWRAGRLVSLGALYPCIGYSNELIHLFLAEELERSEVNPSEGEILETRTLGFSEAVAMARGGDMLDMKSVIALLRADAFLRGRDEIMRQKDWH